MAPPGERARERGESERAAAALARPVRAGPRGVHTPLGRRSSLPPDAHALAITSEAGVRTARSPAVVLGLGLLAEGAAGGVAVVAGEPGPFAPVATRASSAQETPSRDKDTLSARHGAVRMDGCRRMPRRRRRRGRRHARREQQRPIHTPRQGGAAATGKRKRSLHGHARCARACVRVTASRKWQQRTSCASPWCRSWRARIRRRPPAAPRRRARRRSSTTGGARSARQTLDAP